VGAGAAAFGVKVNAQKTEYKHAHHAQHLFHLSSERIDFEKSSHCLVLLALER
jgi:hypothetical protein